jgi:hypothetical protein
VQIFSALVLKPDFKGTNFPRSVKNATKPLTSIPSAEQVWNLASAPNRFSIAATNASTVGNPSTDSSIMCKTSCPWIDAMQKPLKKNPSRITTASRPRDVLLND